MPSALSHDPQITVPGASTDNAVVIFDGTGGTGFGNSTILVDSGGNGRIGIATDTNLITFTNETVTVAGTVAATTLTGAGAGITALAAANITASGTLPALNGAALTALTAANITASGTLPALNGAALTALNGSNIASGTVAVARLGSGSPGSGNFLRGDGSWQAAGGDFSNGGDNGALVLGTNDSNSLTFETSNTARITIEAGGDVGIGTASPARLLHLYQGASGVTSRSTAMLVLEDDTTDEIAIQFMMPSGASTTRQQAIWFGDARDGTRGSILYDQGDDEMRFGTGGYQRMVIASDGEVTIKEDSGWPSVTKGIAKAWCKFNGTSSGPITNDASWNCDATTDSGTGLFTVNFTRNFGSAHFTVVAGGNALHHVEHHAAASGTYSVKGLNSSHANEDAARMYLVAFGDW